MARRRYNLRTIPRQRHSLGHKRSERLRKRLLIILLQLRGQRAKFNESLLASIAAFQHSLSENPVLSERLVREVYGWCDFATGRRQRIRR